MAVTRVSATTPLAVPATRPLATPAREDGPAMGGDTLQLSRPPAPEEAPEAAPDEAPAPLPRGVQVALSGKLDGKRGGQCKVFVERQLGAHFPGPIGAKGMLQPGNHPGFDLVDAPRPGDIFVMRTGSTYGHAGFVKEVHADGSLTVVDSNWHEDGRIHTRTVPAERVRGRMLGYLRANGEDRNAYWKQPLLPNG